MDLTTEQREAMIKTVKEVETSMKKAEASNKDLSDKVGKLKSMSGSVGQNAGGVLDDAFKVLGRSFFKDLQD